MDCLQFAKWLENRDVYDVSEADKAFKHSAQCSGCKAKLHLDEQLDSLIYKAMKPQDMPDSMFNKVDLNLSSMSDGGSKTRYGLYGAFSAVVALLFVFFISLSFSPSIPSLDQMGQYVIHDHTIHDDSILVVHKPEKFGTLENVAISYQAVIKDLPSTFSFIGARICPLGDCKAVHMVFNDQGKRVSLFLIKTADVDFSMSGGRRYSMSDNKYTVNFWKNGRYVFAMVS